MLVKEIVFHPTFIVTMPDGSEAVIPARKYHVASEGEVAEYWIEREEMLHRQRKLQEN